MKAIVYEGIRDTSNTKDIINHGFSLNNGNNQSNTFDNRDYSSNMINNGKDTYVKIILKP